MVSFLSVSLSAIPFTYGWGLGRLPAAESACELGEAVLGRTNAAMVLFGMERVDGS